MARKDVTFHTSGSPVVLVLTLVFVLAKVFEVHPVAAWSWWWVFSPVWISLAFVFSVVVIVVIISVLMGAKKEY